jgi:CheY-like chemotaxis protein
MSSFCRLQLSSRTDGAHGPMSRSAIQPGKRVLIVEDELMIRMLLEDMLDELGYIVAAQAARIEEALQLLSTAEFDLAVLDVNLDGKPISPVADALAARGTPFVFATGYGERGLPESHRDRPTLKKPFEKDSLGRMLRSVVAGK